MKKNKTIVIKCGAHLVDAWVENMGNLLPDFVVKRWDDNYEKEDVKYVIGWKPDALWINQFFNIKAAVSIGSGVDHIENLDQLNENIPLIRTVSPGLIQRMKEFSTLCVLSWHRKLPNIIESNLNKTWNRYAVETADSVNVGIMGYGGMGKSIAESLSYMSYNVSVWASKDRSNVPYDYYFGEDSLNDFVSGCDVLICALPLTDLTENILNKSLMEKVKRNGCVINLGRGGHLVDADLISLIEEGHLSSAYLDGFRVEPLPKDSLFWDIDNIYVTCHSAAYISPEAGPKIIAENIKLFDNGEKVSHMFNQKTGY